MSAWTSFVRVPNLQVGEETYCHDAFSHLGYKQILAELSMKFHINLEKITSLITKL